MLFDERDKVRWRVTGQCGFSKVRIRRNKLFGLTMKIGKVAAPAAGDQNFLSQAIGALEYSDAPSALARFDRAHQAGRASAQHDYIEGMNHEGVVNSFTCKTGSSAASRIFPAGACEHTAFAVA
jgi:hypothetical protein